MSEKLDPEEVQGLMRRLKDRAVEIVESHGGIVSQFVGDEVLALFGIPTAHEDDPVRAVRAAQGLHELARELSPEVEEKIGRPLRMHTGINTGLIVTHLRDDREGLYGITGDAVNTGARLKA
ncbi:MAG: adenylate/guanylate cyclase domain-containing protein, partial [bacterium]